MSMTIVRTMLVVIALGGATAASSWAQQGTSLSGTIRDPQQAAIAYARIKIYPVGAASPLSVAGGPDRTVPGRPSLGRLLRDRGRGGRLQERAEGDHGGGRPGGT